MEISAALVADLTSLTDSLDQPDTDLEALLRALAEDTRRAVRSYLGLTMTLIVDGYPVTLTAMDEFADPGEIATSVLLPLPAVCDAEPGSVIVFYAATAGAFVGFAADMGFALGLGLDALTLDEHRIPPGEGSSRTGLVDMSQVNQAIGILIERGHTPERAGTELRRYARLAQITAPAAARQLIAHARRPGIEHAGSRRWTAIAH